MSQRLYQLKTEWKDRGLVKADDVAVGVLLKTITRHGTDGIMRHLQDVFVSPRLAPAE